jgi:hypothetical protein
VPKGLCWGDIVYDKDMEIEGMVVDVSVNLVIVKYPKCTVLYHSSNGYIRALERRKKCERKMT